MKQFMLGFLTGWLAAFVFVISMTAANAHSWFPNACCHGRDCRHAEPGEVVPTADGWLIPLTGELLPYDSPKVRKTPPEGAGEIYRCTHKQDPALPTICLFVPEMAG